MINIEEFDLLQVTKSMKELSADTSDLNNIKYMTDSDILAVDFDNTKIQYTSRLGISEKCASSVDGIYFTDSYQIFIEFKNGKMRHEQAAVRDKIRDSLFIFCDITDTSLSYTRNYVDFILVYNEEKNQPNSGSNQYIKNHVANNANEELIRFRFKSMEKIYFRKVHTYTEREFNEYINSL